MDGAPVTRETTLAILLGGSAWPKSPQLAASPAFAGSAREFKAYLTGGQGFDLPAANVLDLFDSPKTSPEIVEAIQTYLRERGRATPVPRDLLIYYTGHGGFINGKEYFLAVRSTIEGLEGTSSIRVADLASTLRSSARDLRRFIILDCCFAAAAFKEFQSSPGATARMQTLDAFPKRGTTLLCSSSSRAVSIAPEGAPQTMFSGALLEVLRAGDASLDEPMSLEEVGLRTADLIRARYEERAVRPEVHAPDQQQENIARMPLFPNPAHGGTPVPAIAAPLPASAVPPRPRESRRSPMVYGVGAVAAAIIVLLLVLWRPQPAPVVAPQKPSVATEPARTAPAETTPVRQPPVTEARRTVTPTPPATHVVEPAPTATAPVSAKVPTPVSATIGGLAVRFVALPSGEFRMGCADVDEGCADDERPVRRVAVDPFQIASTEVTQELWQLVMGSNPSDFKGASLPVEHISWTDAQDFLDKLNARRDGFEYRLPTEAEWEYAARAGESSPPSLPAIAWFGLAESSARSSRPQTVGTKRANAWGLFDMLGNVAEWCEDWYSPNYQRVVRGGSWVDSAASVRVSARGKAMPGTRDYSIGLRLVRTHK